MLNRTASQRGIVEFWHTGDDLFVARDNYTSATFLPEPDKDVREQAYAALGRTVGDIRKECLGMFA